MSCRSDCYQLKRGYKSNRIAHCGACHRTFSVVSNFDWHRTGGVCGDPAALGMTEKDRVWAMWGSSFDNKWWNDEVH